MNRTANIIEHIHHAAHNAVRPFIIYGFSGIAALIAGIICAIGRIDLIAISAGLVVMSVLVTSRKVLLWSVILGGLVIAGLMQLYMPDSKNIRYLVPLAALFLLLHGFMDYLNMPASVKERPVSNITAWMLAFIVIALASSALNWDGFGTAIMGNKGYFQIWIFFFALVLILWKPDELKFLPKIILLIALIQLPFVIHEYLYLVPKRIGLGDEIVPVDIVAGTFGGNLYGGGANAVLSAFLFVVVACLLALWKRGELSNIKTLALSLILIAPVFFNETKISAIYLPVIIMTLFYRDIIERPQRFLMIGGLAFVVLSILMTALIIFHPGGKINSWSELVSDTIEKQASTVNERSGQYGELTRWTTLTFWVRENISANPIYILIGHGPGSSRVQEGGLNLAETLAEKRYGGMKIGNTAFSALLWDTGILGLGTILGLFFAAFRTAGRLATYFHDKDPYQAAIFDGLRTGVVILTISLAHKDFFAFHLPYQTLVMLIMGILVITQASLTQSSRDNYY